MPKRLPEDKPHYLVNTQGEAWALKREKDKSITIQRKGNHHEINLPIGSVGYKELNGHDDDGIRMLANGQQSKQGGFEKAENIRKFVKRQMKRNGKLAKQRKS
jgi:hypothetical protein